MADRSSFNLAVGLALVVAGGLLIWWGYDEAQSVGNQLARAISGAHSNQVMWKYIGGAVCAVIGLVLVVRK